MIFPSIYASAIQAEFAQRSAMARMLAMQREAESISGIHTLQLGRAQSGKCKCCGSVEFRVHNSLSFCAYCRTPA